MKVTKSNKTKLTITITGDASEIALMLNLAKAQAQVNYNKTSGIAKNQMSELVNEYSNIESDINNGNYFC